MTWPYPGDAPVVIARRVAWAYRQRLFQLDPGQCRQLDEVMRQLGQQWAAPRPAPTDPNKWISASEAARLAAVNVDTIGNLRRSGRLSGRQVGPQRWQYQVRDILALSSRPRRRKISQTTGATDPER